MQARFFLLGSGERSLNIFKWRWVWLCPSLLHQLHLSLLTKWPRAEFACLLLIRPRLHPFLCIIKVFFWSELCSLSCTNYQDSEVFVFVDTFEPRCLMIEAYVAYRQFCPALLAYKTEAFTKAMLKAHFKISGHAWKVITRQWHYNPRTFLTTFLNELI